MTLWLKSYKKNPINPHQGFFPRCNRTYFNSANNGDPAAVPFKNCKHSPIFLSVLIYRMTMIRKCLQLWNVFHIICSSRKLFVLKWNCRAFRSNSLRITLDGFDQRLTTYWKPFARTPSFSLLWMNCNICQIPAFSWNPSPISLNTPHWRQCYLQSTV